MKQLKTTLVGLPIFICFILISGCGGHDTSTLSRSLIGHWVTESGKTHFYVDSSSLIMLDGDRRMDQDYTVLESNESENWIKIRVKTGYGGGHDKHLAFSSDRKSINQTIEIEILGETRSTSGKWEYVDARTAP
jgi:hypothetical protein